jgi:hypothetical protein
VSHPCCPNPGVWQQLSTGPLGAHIDTFARQLLDQAMRVGQQSLWCTYSPTSAAGSSDMPSGPWTSTNSALMLFCRTAIGAIAKSAVIRIP